MTSMHPQSGLRIGDRYEFTRRIAGGGMGEVWAAHDVLLDREVAVKLLRREYVDDPGFVERFRAEARHAASLSHPGIAAVYDYGEIDGSAFLVMELVPGQPLSTILSDRGAVPAVEVVPLLQQTAQALAAAHSAGLVHRDVKPGNLLVTPDHRVKVTDFGIARAGGQAPLTRTGEVMGTAQYLAPEQAMGRPATASSDVYALGVVAYEALAGRRPFDAENPVAVAMSQVNDTPPPLPPTVPAAIASVVLQALAKDPDERPHDAAAFSDALGRALRGQTPAAAPTQALTAPTADVPAASAVEPPTTGRLPPVRPTDDVIRPGRPGRRSTGMWVLVALLAVALAALVVLLLTQAGGTRDDTPSTPVPSTPSAVTSTGATTAVSRTIAITASDYLGKPADEVAATLTGKGLRVSTQPVTTDDYDTGAVAAVSPTGNLQAGDVVTLGVATAPTATPTATTTTPTSTPTTTTPTSDVTTTPTSDVTTPATVSTAEGNAGATQAGEVAGG